MCIYIDIKIDIIHKHTHVVVINFCFLSARSSAQSASKLQLSVLGLNSLLVEHRFRRLLCKHQIIHEASHPVSKPSSKLQELEQFAEATWRILFFCFCPGLALRDGYCNCRTCDIEIPSTLLSPIYL